MFGKLMSISDDLMWRYYELLSDMDLREVASKKALVEREAEHPMEVKKDLATELVKRFHGSCAADSARRYFAARHQKKSVPDEIRKSFSAREPIWICRLLVNLEFAKSNSEARRLIAQGAVKVDGETISDTNFEFTGAAHKVLEVGKNRIARGE